MSTEQQARINRIEGLASTQALFDFAQAAKALWRDIRFGQDEFDDFDLSQFMLDKMTIYVREAEAAGPLTVNPGSTLHDAITYVKRRLKDGASRTCAEHEATALYNLDAEAASLVSRNLTGK